MPGLMSVWEFCVHQNAYGYILLISFKMLIKLYNLGITAIVRTLSCARRSTDSIDSIFSAPRSKSICILSTGDDYAGSHQEGSKQVQDTTSTGKQYRKQQSIKAITQEQPMKQIRRGSLGIGSSDTTMLVAKNTELLSFDICTFVICTLKLYP